MPANAGDIRDVGSIPGSGRSPGGSHCSIFSWRIPCIEEPIVHRVAKIWTRRKPLSMDARNRLKNIDAEVE